MYYRQEMMVALMLSGGGSGSEEIHFRGRADSDALDGGDMKE